MATAAALRTGVAAVLGCPVQQVSTPRPIGGGDVSRAHRVEVDGRRCVVKHLDPPVPGLLDAEARGLGWLAAARAVDVAAVLGVEDGPDVALPLLILAHVDSGPTRPDLDERLGRGLAALHAAGAEHFGAPWAGFVGPLPQPNDSVEDGWAGFLGRRRLRPAAQAAEQRGGITCDDRRVIEQLVTRLPSLLPTSIAPARLHGDLWSGNVMTGRDGAPVLIDPAAYGGCDEVDLAMLELFGGPRPRLRAAYGEVRPLADAHEERVRLHQIHPLLVHAALFGGGYGPRAIVLARRYL